MSFIIRLQNLPLTASSLDIRTFFRGLSIPDGGVHIVGGPEGDAFIAFSTDEDARQAMQMSGQKLKESAVRLSLSSRNEMQKVIALTQAAAELPPPSSSNGQSNDSHRSQPANNASGLSSFTGAPTPTMGPNMNMLGGLGAAMHLNGFFGQSPASLQMNGFSGSQQGTGGTHDMTTATAAPQLGSGAGTPSAATHFGLPQGVPGMNFPQILASAGAMNINPAAMMSMGIPTSIINLATQTPNAFTNAHARPQMAQNSGMPMPISGGGGFPGMNPAFMAGGGMGMGHGVQNNIRHNGPRAQPPIQGGIRGFAPNGVGPGGPLRPGFASGHGERSRSPSRERRDRDRDGHRGGPDRRRRSRSRDRDRGERRRRSRSRSRSRSPKSRPSSARRDSRDKREENADKRGSRRDSRDSSPLPPPTPYNITEAHWPAVKLSGIPNETPFRELKEFLHADIMGGGDGIVRHYDEGVAYIKLEKPSDFPRAYRYNGRKIRNSTIKMEGISIERWVDEYKLSKIRVERDAERDRGGQNRDRDDRGADSDRHGQGHGHDRGSRPSRFNSAPASSSYIVIRNLSATITTKDVSNRLLDGIPIADLVVTAGPPCNGRYTSLAFVKLDSPEAVQQSINMIVRSMDGSNLVVEVSNANDFHLAKNKTGKTAETAPNFNFNNSRMDDTKSIFDLESGLDEDSCCIMIKGAPPTVADRDVFDFFSDIGLMPMNVKVMYDNEGSYTGQIICEFQDSHKARRATTKDGMIFGRGPVQVELIPSGRKRIQQQDSTPKQSYRPSLLGPRPMGTMDSSFQNPPGPNPFVQALQGGGGGGMRPRMRGPNPRFGIPRPEFGKPNGIDRDDRMGGGMGRGRGISRPPISPVPNEVNFGKPGCVLALENVPYKASMDDILTFLSSILKLDISRDRIIRRFDETEKPTGDARVAFDTPSEAKLAHDRLIGSKMWNRLITYTIV